MSQSTGLLELESAVAANPGNPKLLYLLGAELAQTGRYDDAVIALTSAIAIDPTLHTARLQLGLLHLTMAEPDRSMAVLAALDDLPEDDALKHFKRGLEALAADELDDCVAALRRGIELNSVNPALNDDMSLIVARIAEARAARPKLDPQPAFPRIGERTKRTDFKLYKDIEDT
jgi:cytochrome c-type biogenesis protein CcmH/NrfG